MALNRDPFAEMERLFEQMRRSMFATPGAYTALPGGDKGSDDVGAFETDTNLSIEPTDEGYVVLADLPGFERDEIDLRFHEGVLTIEAAHEVDRAGEGVRRRRSRHVHERLTVPGEVAVEDVSASYHNGVLEVLLPTVEDAADEGVHIDIE